MSESSNEGQPLAFTFDGDEMGLKVRRNDDATVYLSVVDGETADPYLPIEVGGSGDALHQAFLYCDCHREGNVLHLELTGNGLQGGEIKFQLNWDDILLLPEHA
ncbi:MAG: hypothetical protein ACKVOE_09645 [Rickettsiales bacterium]